MSPPVHPCMKSGCKPAATATAAAAAPAPAPATAPVAVPAKAAPSQPLIIEIRNAGTFSDGEKPRIVAVQLAAPGSGLAPGQLEMRQHTARDKSAYIKYCGQRIRRRYPRVSDISIFSQRLFFAISLLNVCSMTLLISPAHRARFFAMSGDSATELGATALIWTFAMMLTQLSCVSNGWLWTRGTTGRHVRAAVPHQLLAYGFTFTLWATLMHVLFFSTFSLADHNWEQHKVTGKDVLMVLMGVYYLASLMLSFVGFVKSAFMVELHVELTDVNNVLGFSLARAARIIEDNVQLESVVTGMQGLKKSVVNSGASESD